MFTCNQDERREHTLIPFFVEQRVEVNEVSVSRNTVTIPKSRNRTEDVSSPCKLTGRVITEVRVTDRLLLFFSST